MLILIMQKSLILLNYAINLSLGREVKQVNIYPIWNFSNNKGSYE